MIKDLIWIIVTGCDSVNLEKLNPLYVLSRGSLAAEFTVDGVEERRSHTGRGDATQKLTYLGPEKPRQGSVTESSKGLQEGSQSHRGHAAPNINCQLRQTELPRVPFL